MNDPSVQMAMDLRWHRLTENEGAGLEPGNGKQQAKKVRQSAKLELLMRLRPEMVEKALGILLFSQFTQMLGLIETELGWHGIDYCNLTGRTSKRDAVIERFRRGEANVLLISLKGLKAGGVG